MGAGMNPRPLEPAATCPQAEAVTPGAQVNPGGQLRAAPAPPPAPRKSPPSAPNSDARPRPSGAGATPTPSPRPPQQVPPRPGATAARRGSGRTGRSLVRVTSGSALPGGWALGGLLREPLPLGLPPSLPAAAMRGCAPGESSHSPGLSHRVGSPSAPGRRRSGLGTRAGVGWETFDSASDPGRWRICNEPMGLGGGGALG